jgi:hypothetical protein
MAQRTSQGANVSCVGDISPAFAAAFGASVDIALLLRARNADARATAKAAREQRRTSRRGVLPVEIATTRALPASRVQVDIIPALRGSPIARR